MEIDDYMGSKSIFAGAAATDLDNVEEIEEIDDELIENVQEPANPKQKTSSNALLKDGPMAPSNSSEAPQMLDDSEEPQPPPYKLSISEYEEMSQRHEASLKQLDQIIRQLTQIKQLFPQSSCGANGQKNASEPFRPLNQNLAPSNGGLSPADQADQQLKSLQQTIETECEKMSVRIKFLKLESQRQSSTVNGVLIDQYRVSLEDFNVVSFCILRKYEKGRRQYKEGQSFIADKIKLGLTSKGELCFMSTQLTVFQEESDVEVESLELSQKQRDHYALDYTKREQEVSGLINGQMNQLNQPLAQLKFDMRQLFSTESSADVPTLASTKQIQQKAEFQLNEWNEQALSAGQVHIPQSSTKLKSFCDILSWKIPDNLLSSAARESQEKLARREREEGFVCSYATHAHLYQLDLVTNRVREQNVSFVGIVQFVKEYQDNKSGSVGKDNNSALQMVTSHVDLESAEDKSRVALFVKHSRKVDLKSALQKGMVLLVKDALRKISNQIDIYTQLQYQPGQNLKVIGTTNDQQMTDFQARNTISLIRCIPTDQIVRYILKILGFIIDTNFIKIQYKCDQCRRDINNEQMCSSGCIIKNPILHLQVLCIVQDGTSKSSLELKNQRVLTAFNITEEQQKMFKTYCLKFGAFQNPGAGSQSAGNPLYKEVLNVFKKHECWSQMIFYCKPYAKVSNNDKKQNQSGAFGGALAQKSYGETISKPSFMLKDREKEIFLNGEVQLTRKTQGYGEQGRSIKKTIICLKALQVESSLNSEALRNTIVQREQKEQEAARVDAKLGKRKNDD